MTDRSVERPAGWSAAPNDAESTLARYRYETDAGTAFIVSLHRWRSDGREYELRLSVVTPRSPQVRRDYPVAEYETEREAFDDLYPFLKHVSDRPDAGLLSATDPTEEGVRGLIADFTRERSSSPVDRLVRRFRR